jgi:hypothetical protein
MKMPVVKVVVDSADVNQDYLLPAHIANGLYDKGEIMMANLYGRNMDYFDPRKRWISYRVWRQHG